MALGFSAKVDQEAAVVDLAKLASFLVHAVLGCASTNEPAGTLGSSDETQSPEVSGSSSGATIGACTSDAQCADGTFCDLGACVQFYEPRHYGWPCDPARLPEDDPILASKLNPCGAYICRDLRCRSCEGNADCKVDATCIQGKDEKHPGWACGLAAD